MLAVAYMMATNRVTSTHFPEGCYSAQGFTIDRDEPVEMPISPDVAVRGRKLLASRGDRQETILYWRRTGDRIVTGATDEAEEYLHSALNGVACDGTLVRVSTLAGPFDSAVTLLASFARLLVESSPPRVRNLLIGQGLASSVATAG